MASIYSSRVAVQRPGVGSSSSMTRSPNSSPLRLRLAARRRLCDPDRLSCRHGVRALGLPRQERAWRRLGGTADARGERLAIEPAVRRVGLCQPRVADPRARPGGFLRQRSLRLLVPLAFGVAVIVPPQSWVELVTQHGYRAGFATFWTHDYFRFRRLGGIGCRAQPSLVRRLSVVVHGCTDGGRRADPHAGAAAGIRPAVCRATAGGYPDRMAGVHPWLVVPHGL